MNIGFVWTNYNSSFTRGAVALFQLPARRYWEISRDAHRIYKRYLSLSPADRAAFIANGTTA